MMESNNRPATTRALAVACTIVVVVLASAAVYQFVKGNAIALAVFAVAAFIFLFVTAGAWGVDIDNRNGDADDSDDESVEASLTPQELHDLVEVDYAMLLRRTGAKRMVVTLRMEAPFVTVEAVSEGWRNDWLVEAESMFEGYIKAWLKSSGSSDE